MFQIIPPCTSSFSSLSFYIYVYMYIQYILLKLNITKYSNLHIQLKDQVNDISTIPIVYFLGLSSDVGHSPHVYRSSQASMVIQHSYFLHIEFFKYVLLLKKLFFMNKNARFRHLLQMQTFQLEVLVTLPLKGQSDHFFSFIFEVKRTM